jgi:hypothetical protein
MDSANGKTAKDYVISLAIDQVARTATIDNYAAVRIVTKADNEIMLFMPEPGSVVGVLSGTLSRITGDASVDVNSLVDGAYKFYGLRAGQVPVGRLFGEHGVLLRSAGDRSG